MPKYKEIMYVLSLHFDYVHIFYTLTSHVSFIIQRIPCSFAINCMTYALTKP